MVGRLDGEPVPQTSAPRDLAIWITILPTPPAPPCTSTVCLERTAALSTNPSQAVMNTSGNAAASRIARMAGRGCRACPAAPAWILASSGLAPLAAIWTRTWPGPGMGDDIVARRNGLPEASRMVACIVVDRVIEGLLGR